MLARYGLLPLMSGPATPIDGSCQATGCDRSSFDKLGRNDFDRKRWGRPIAGFAFDAGTLGRTRRPTSRSVNKLGSSGSMIQYVGQPAEA